MKTRRSGVLSLSFIAACGASAWLVTLAACVGDDPSTPPTLDPGSDAATAPGNDSGTPTLDTGAPQADGGADSGPKRFCETQSPLLGVTDFFCADFDGTRADEGWTKTDGPDSGTFMLATDIAFSAPNSLITVNGASLEWDKTGAATFKEVDAEFEVNTTTLGGVTPPTTGSVVLFEVTTIDTQFTFAYTRGGSIEGTSNYTGYYIDIASCPSACLATQKAIPTALPVNTWTKVSIVWTNGGLYKISYNDVPVLDVETGGIGSTSTKVGAVLGLQTNAASPAFPRTAFDNFVFSVKR